MRQRRATELPIGALARSAGTKVQTVRYYEQIGLLPAPARTEGGQRVYNTDARDRLAFIRHARELGFEMADVRALLELSDRPEGDCGLADEIAGRHLTAVEAKIAKLTALKGELERMLDCCGHGAVAECRVIEALADHGLCGGDH